MTVYVLMREVAHEFCDCWEKVLEEGDEWV